MSLFVRIRARRDGFVLHADFETTGRAISLLGPSGAGKSTLLAALAGLVRPAEGEIRLDDRVLFSSERGIDLAPEARRVGLVFQDGLLFPHLSVAGNLRYGRRRRGSAAERIDFDEVVDLLDLRPLLDRRPRALSGGERQRVALGRGLLAAPDLLLLDEPLAALDAGLRRRILPYLVAVRERFDVPLVYVTHLVSEALEIAEEVVILDAGRVLAAGRFHEVLGRPEVFATARRLGLDNVLPAVVVSADPDGGTLRVRAGAVALKVPFAEAAAGDRVFLAVRADEILLSRDEPRGLSARNALPARVVGLSPVGNLVLVRLDAGFPLSVEVTPEAARELGLAAGGAVYAVVKAHSLRVERGGPIPRQA